MSQEKNKIKIPFTRFVIEGSGTEYLQEVMTSGRVQGDGPFSNRAENLLKTITSAKQVVLTASGTDALEMAVILSGIKPGDEVIVPSFTFVSSVNAIVLRGGIPVFADIDPKTLNLSPKEIERNLTKKTKAIMPVHYAGVSCQMTEILAIAKQARLKIIEDAAHGMGAHYEKNHLGTIGDFGALSFHETKNISCGEGGALLINDPDLFDRAEVVRDKGTNRKKFLRGEVDRYTWVDVGSSFLPSELQAALLLSQLEILDAINGRRIEIWNKYHSSLRALESEGFLQRPETPKGVDHNAHIYWILTRTPEERESLRKFLLGLGIQTTSHYECLHRAPVAKVFARYDAAGLPVTESIASRILRLPLFKSLSNQDVDFVTHSIEKFYKN